MIPTIIPLSGEAVTSIPITRDDLDLHTIALFGADVTIIELGLGVPPVIIPDDPIDDRPGVTYPPGGTAYDPTANELEILSRINTLADSIADSIKFQIDPVSGEIAENEAAAAEAFAELRQAIADAQAAIAENHEAAQEAFGEVNAAISKAMDAITENHAAVLVAQKAADDAFTELGSISTTIVAMQDNIGDNSASIFEEVGARTTAIDSVSGKIDTISAKFDDASASILAESVARASATEALTAVQTTQQSSIDGNTSAIQDEAITRSTATDSLATKIDNLSASTIAGYNAAISSEATARTTADSATADRVDQISAIMNGSGGAAVTNEVVARVGADGALSATITQLSSHVDGVSATLSSESTTRVNGDTALSGRIDTLTASTAANITAAIQSEAAARTTATDALAAKQDTLTTAVNNNASSIQTEATARTTADKATSDTVTQLTSTVNGNTSGIQQEAVTRSTQDGSLSARIDTVSSTSGTNTAAISSEQATRTSQDSALSGRIDTLASQTGTNIAAAVQAEAVTRTNQDSALAAADTAIGSRVDGNVTAIQTEQTARTTNDKALSDSITNIQSAFNGKTAIYDQQISTLQTADTSKSQSITTLQANAAAGGTGGNELANSELNGMDGWATGSSVAGATMSLNLPGWSAPPAVNVFYVSIPGTPAASNYADFVSPLIPTSPNTRYETSALCAYHRAAYVQVFLEYFDSAGTHISYSLDTGGQGVGGYSYGGGSGILSNFTQIGFFQVSPSNAASRRMYIRVVTDGTESSPYGFYTHPYTGRAGSLQTTLTPYSPGTQVNLPALQSTITSNATAAANATSAVANSVNDLKTVVGGNTSTISTIQSSVNGLSNKYQIALSLNNATGGYSITGVQRADGTGAVFTMEINANVYINGTLLVNGTVSSTKLLASVGVYTLTHVVGTGDYVWTTVPFDQQSLGSSDLTYVGDGTIKVVTSGVYAISSYVVLELGSNSNEAAYFAMQLLNNNNQVYATTSAGNMYYSLGMAMSLSYTNRFNAGDVIAIQAYSHAGNYDETYNQFNGGTLTIVRLGS